MTDSEQGNLIISSDAPGAELAGECADEADSVELELREVRVPVAVHGSRLDRALVEIVPEFSRSYLQQLIVSGAVQVNGVLSRKAAAKVKAFDLLKVELRQTPQSQAFRPESMVLDVVFEDEFLLVVNKPAGLVVHPAPGNWSGTLLNGLLARDPQAAFLPRAGIVHRLDKDTSGLMVVARQRQVMDQLVALIAARDVNRQYLALAHGPWQGPKTRLVAQPVGRDPKNRLKMAVVDLERHSGKTAATEVMLLQTGLQHCLVKCKLQTGRTHQIRVHMASLGHPLVSDAVYGGRPEAGLKRQALHAFRLAFEHPVTGQPLDFRSPVPEDMSAAMAELGLSYNPKDLM